MSNIINFQIEKMATPDKKILGYQVITTNGKPVNNPLSGIIEMFGEGLGDNIGEKWKQAKTPETKLFFANDKEVTDYIAYQLKEFKDK